MDSVLRDLHREQAKMQGDISNLSRHYENLLDYVRQYIEATTIEWARLAVDHPHALLLVVETTHILTTFSRVRGEIWDQKIQPTYSKQVQADDNLDDLDEPPF